MSAEWATVLDEWATRFFAEMDYQKEAFNTATFKRQMAGLEGIEVADVYPDLTSSKVGMGECVQGAVTKQLLPVWYHPPCVVHNKRQHAP